jgi:phage-related protein
MDNIKNYLYNELDKHYKNIINKINNSMKALNDKNKKETFRNMYAFSLESVIYLKHSFLNNNKKKKTLRNKSKYDRR